MYAPHEPPGLQCFQEQFGARIRDPEHSPLPNGVPASRMQVYESLLFNNLQGFLCSCFPISRELLGVENWEKMVRLFLIEHHCRSPLFRDIPLEFLEWLEQRPDAVFPDKPFLQEFLHYEWLEMAVAISPEQADWSLIDRTGDLMDGIPVVTPTARIACYRYPVQQIGPHYMPAECGPAPHCHILYRDDDDRVRFVNLTPFSAQLLETLGYGKRTGREAIEQIALAVAHPAPEKLIGFGQEQLEQYRNSGILLGALLEKRRPR